MAECVGESLQESGYSLVITCRKSGQNRVLREGLTQRQAARLGSIFDREYQRRFPGSFLISVRVDKECSSHT